MFSSCNFSFIPHLHTFCIALPRSPRLQSVYFICECVCVRFVWFEKFEITATSSSSSLSLLRQKQKARQRWKRKREVERESERKQTKIVTRTEWYAKKKNHVFSSFTISRPRSQPQSLTHSHKHSFQMGFEISEKNENEWKMEKKNSESRLHYFFALCAVCRRCTAARTKSTSNSSVHIWAPR